MNDILKNETATTTLKFITITFIEKGLIVTKKNKEVSTILFSELKKIYIKKCKISFLNKLVFFFFLLILTSFLLSYLPREIVLLASILYIPLIVKMNTYKSYQLHLHLCNNTFFCKTFNMNTKQEYINLVNMGRQEIFYHQIKSNIKIIKPSENKRIEEKFVFSDLSIA